MSEHPMSVVQGLVAPLNNKVVSVVVEGAQCQAFEAGLLFALSKPEYAMALGRQLDKVHSLPVQDQIREFRAFVDRFVKEHPLEVTDG